MDEASAGEPAGGATSILLATSALVVIDKLIQVGFVAVLARLLSPAETGIAAAAATVVGLLALIAQIGMASHLIQMRDFSAQSLAVAQGVLTAMAVAIFLILEIGAPAAGEWFHNDQVASAIRVMAPIVLAQIFTTIPAVALARKLRAREAVLTDLLAGLVGNGLVAIPLAALGYGFWALVAGALGHAWLRALLLSKLAGIRVRPALDVRAGVQLCVSSSGFMLNGLLNRVLTDFDRWIVGRFLSSADLGLYARATGLMAFPSGMFSTVVDQLVFPSIAKVHHQPERLQARVLSAVELTALAGLPTTIILVIAGPALIRVVLGEAWLGAVAPFEILCAAIYFRLSDRLAWTILRGMGRAYGLAMIQACIGLISIIGCLYAWRFGLEGIAWVVVAAASVSYVVLVAFILTITKVGLPGWLAAHRPGVAAALLVAVAAGGATLTSELLGLPPLADLLLLATVTGVAGLAAILFAPSIFLGRPARAVLATLWSRR
jgi:O-antigen/teichoic acid export membrane protein